jgi:predicted dehydrogenase
MYINILVIMNKHLTIHSINNASTGGIFHDTAVHDIDLICWILGEYPTCVTTQASTLTPEIADIGDFDTVIITLKFPSGTLGIIDISRLSSHGYDQRVEVRHNTPVASRHFIKSAVRLWSSCSLVS